MRRGRASPTNLGNAGWGQGASSQGSSQGGIFGELCLGREAPAACRATVAPKIRAFPSKTAVKQAETPAEDVNHGCLLCNLAEVIQFFSLCFKLDFELLRDDM